MVVGDLLNIIDVQRAVEGVDYMYFTFAVQDGLMEGTTIAAMAAAQAGTLMLLHLVHLSSFCWKCRTA